MGGTDLWSNGIDLTAIESAPDAARESWWNINAIDDVVHDIITTDTHLTSAALGGNAGAGGAILALAADLVYARDGIVLNPHYQTMHLYGSEYWTYLLPRRVGSQRARELTEQCEPVSTAWAKSIGLVDDIFPGPLAAFRTTLRQQLKPLPPAPILTAASGTNFSSAGRHEAVRPLQAYRDDELAHMRRDFVDPAYHQARRRFLFGSANAPSSPTPVA